MRLARCFLLTTPAIFAGFWLTAGAALAEGSSSTTIAPTPALPTTTTLPVPTLPPLPVPTLVMPTLPPLAMPQISVPPLVAPSLPEMTLPALPAPVLPALPGSGGSGTKSTGTGSSNGTRSTGAATSGASSPQVLLDVLRSGQSPTPIELVAPQEANTSTGRLPVKTFAISGLGAMLLYGAASTARRRRSE